MHGCEELSQPYQSQPASTSSGSDMKAAGSPISFPIPTSLGQEIDEDPEVALETLPGITTDFGEEFSTYEELLIPASPLLRSYLPTNNRIPASTARIPIALEGIGKRMRADRPVSISQSANSNIPIDTTPMVI